MFHSSSSSSTITFNPRLSKYYVTFGGTTIETTVTDKAATATKWARDINTFYGPMKTLVAGLNVECRPHHIINMSNVNKSATLSLCIDNKCLILQLFHMDFIPQSIKDFLLNYLIIFACVEAEEVVSKLKDEYGLDCRCKMDLRASARESIWPGRVRYSRPGLKDIARGICRLNIEKPLNVFMSNWEARVLSEAQIEYACIDAFASYKIGYYICYDDCDMEDFV